MTNNLIPDDVEEFILERIDSVAELEALLLLRGNSTQEWRVDGLARRLYITEKQTIEVLTRLRTHGFVTATAGESPRYQYQPDSIEVQRIIDRVANVYSKHLVPITNLIDSKPRTRAIDPFDQEGNSKEKKEAISSIFPEAQEKKPGDHAALGLTSDPNEGRPLFYFVRFLSFVLILIAILDKNLKKDRRVKPTKANRIR